MLLFSLKYEIFSVSLIKGAGKKIYEHNCYSAVTQDSHVS